MINYKFIYYFALVILFPFAVIYFTYIRIKNNDLNFIKNRLGLVTKLNNQNNICVHCASLGEVNGATGLIKEIEKKSLPIHIDKYPVWNEAYKRIISET